MNGTDIVNQERCRMISLKILAKSTRSSGKVWMIGSREIWLSIGVNVHGKAIPFNTSIAYFDSVLRMGSSFSICYPLACTPFEIKNILHVINFGQTSVVLKTCWVLKSTEEICDLRRIEKPPGLYLK